MHLRWRIMNVAQHCADCWAAVCTVGLEEMPQHPKVEKPPKVYAPPSYTAAAKAARESGLVPLSEERLTELRRRLALLQVGVHCEFIYLTEGPTQSHLTRKGEFVSYEEETNDITLLGGKGTFYRIPIQRVFHATYSVEEQGGTIK